MSGWEKSAVTLATFIPAAGAVVIALVPGRLDRLIRTLGILFTGAALGAGIAMLDILMHLRVPGHGHPRDTARGGR